MPDMMPSVLNDVVSLPNLTSEDRIVIVVNPDSVVGGSVVYDKNVPIGKQVRCMILVNGPMSDVE